MSIGARTLGIAIGALALVGIAGGLVLPAYAATTMPACADRLTAFKAELRKAPKGPQSDAAKKDYKAAVAAHKKNDDATCVTQLNAAEAALK